MNHDSTPTPGSTEQGATPLPVRTVPAEMPVDLFAAPTGKLFQLVGVKDGEPHFIPADADRAAFENRRWLWASESYLTDAFAGPLTRVERAA